MDRIKCDCAKPGYCPRFDRTMAGRLYQICRDTCDPPCPNRKAYLIRWSQQANRITGLGDVVNMVTRITGIKTALKKKAARTGKKCGCDKRREKLNAAVPVPVPTKTARSKTAGTERQRK